MPAVERLHAYSLSLTLLAATAYPLSLDPFGGDDYPLSTYPMFSAERPRAARITSAVARQADGSEQPIGPSYVANSEAMQAIQTLRNTVGRGRRASRKLCRKIAKRIAAADGQLGAAHEVLLVTQKVNAIEFLAGDAEPLQRKVHARCPVGPVGPANPGGPRP